MQFRIIAFHDWCRSRDATDVSNAITIRSWSVAKMIRTPPTVRNDVHGLWFMRLFHGVVWPSAICLQQSTQSMEWINGLWRTRSLHYYNQPLSKHALCVKLHLNGQSDKHQGRQSRIADSFEPTHNAAFSLKTERKRTTTKLIVALAKLTVSSSQFDSSLDILINSRSDAHQWTNTRLSVCPFVRSDGVWHNNTCFSQSLRKLVTYSKAL